MAEAKKTKRDKYLMDKRIISILKRAPKRGIWMKDLAEKLNISRPLLNYYLFGMKKQSKWFSGRIKKEITTRNEGNNRFALLKANHK
jgi:hypothetical protein